MRLGSVDLTTRNRDLRAKAAQRAALTLPSALANSVPIIWDVADEGAGTDRITVHLPDPDRAVVGAPEYVAAAVATEVGRVEDVPIGRNVADDFAGADRVAIHLPDHDRAVVGAPEHVAVAVAVEIGCAGDVPIVRDI